MEKETPFPATNSLQAVEDVPLQTNFFQNLLTFGDSIWSLTIQVEKEHIIISTMLMEQKDEPRSNLIFKGTAEELDLQYFSALKTPVQETKELFANNNAYRRNLEAEKLKAIEKTEKTGKTKSSAEQEKTPTPKIDRSAELKKNYEESIKRITELSAEWLYKQAIDILPSPEDYPDKKTELEKLKKELEWKSNQLFIS